MLEEEGDTPSIFPGESVEEPTLLRLPSNRSGEWLQEREHRNRSLREGWFSLVWGLNQVVYRLTRS